MNAPLLRAALLGALVLLAASGLLVHPRLQTGAAANAAVSTAFSLVDLVLVTALFARRATALTAHLLNGVLVLYGTVMMGHYSLARALSAGDPAAFFLNPAFEGAVVLWADFLAGYALWRLWAAAKAD